MIARRLLAATGGRAPCICVYGPAGVKKTHAIATLPPPVAMSDFEGGSGSLLPWIERSKKFDETEWTPHTQAEREASFEALDEEVRAQVTLKPRPYVSVTYY